MATCLEKSIRKFVYNIKFFIYNNNLRKYMW